MPCALETYFETGGIWRIRVWVPIELVLGA